MKRPSQWSRPIGDAAAFARSSGRRRWNRQRQLAAAERRAEAMGLYLKFLGQSARVWGIKAQVARALGVHPSTIGRDLRRAWVEASLTSVT